jgi:hypothetical protein
MNSCCAPAATSPQNFLSTLAALVTGLVAHKPVSREAAREASAAHQRARARALGTWGGYQAAPPSR